MRRQDHVMYITVLEWSIDCNVKKREEIQMLHWSLVFLVIALIAGALGFLGIAGTAAGIAKILFFVFLVLWLIGLLSRSRTI